MWWQKLLEFGKWSALGATLGFGGGFAFGAISSLSIASLSFSWATALSTAIIPVIVGAVLGAAFGTYKAVTLKNPAIQSADIQNKTPNHITAESAKDLEPNLSKTISTDKEQNNSTPVNNLSNKNFIEKLFTNPNQPINKDELSSQTLDKNQNEISL